MLIATGTSFRAFKDDEMIRFDQEFAKVSAQTQEDTLEIVLTHGIYLRKKTAKKRYLVNGVGKRKKDLTSNLFAVLFEPQDLLIILGSPSNRRNYFNSTLSQIDWKYAQALTNYQKGMKQRNKLLYQIREGEASLSQLEFWDQHLLKHGQYITQQRQKLIDYLNHHKHQSQFLSSIYQTYQIPQDQLIFQFDYDHSHITKERLQHYQQAEIASANTLIGPHRDELMIQFIQNITNQSSLGYKPIASYGSRGQQRLAVLALKLAQANYIHHQTNTRPIILLDDIFSELDHTNDQIVLDIIKNYQTIITTTEITTIDLKTDVKIIKLS